MTVTGTHHRQVGDVLWEVLCSFQRRGEAWRQEPSTGGSSNMFDVT